MFITLFWKTFNLGVDSNILFLVGCSPFPQPKVWELNFDGSSVTQVQEGHVVSDFI